MIKKITTLLLLCVMLDSVAQTPTYFTANNVGGNNSIPFNSGTQMAWRRAQFCIPAGSMGTIPSGNNITTVYFQAASAANVTYPNFYVRLKTATNAGMTGVANGPFESNMVQVFHGVNFQMNTTSGGWVAIQLQTPFLYDPTFPLIVDFEHDHTNAAGPTVSQPGTISGPGNGRQWGFNSGGLISGVGTQLLNFGIDVIPATPCTGAPPANSVSPVTFSTCPGTWNPSMKLAASYSLGGLQYQWYESTISQFGPWTAMSGATLATAPVPTLGVTTWFQAVASCTNVPNSSTSLTPSQYYVEQSVVVNNAPYYENFEGVPVNDRLPNCSWSSDALGITALTYTSASTMNRLPRSGSKFAAFKNSPAGTTHYWTNGINLVPGITYSASVWYQTDLTGANNWSDLSIMLGTSQSATGLTTIASTGGPAVSLVYKSLSNKFTVPSAGVYYIAVKATGASGTAQYLSWDDLAIEIPCSLNTPTLSVSASKNTICQGESVTLSASGGDTYTWDNNGGTGNIVTVMPIYNTLYTVTGTKAGSSCEAKASVMVMVNPSPFVNVVSNPPTGCAGAPVTLMAAGAGSYLWNTGANGASTVVYPSASTSYTVTGSNSFGCSHKAVYNLVVNELPNVTASGVSTICKGESTFLVASGAEKYLWKSNNVFITGNPVSVAPQSKTTYTVEGTDENGCTGVFVISLSVDPCVGIGENSVVAGIKVYPNPTGGVFTIEGSVLINAPVQVSDVTGRILMSVATGSASTYLDISSFAAGIYYVNIPTVDGVERIKLVKE